MACLKLFTLATTLILAVAITVRADAQKDYELRKILKDALLTESNIYAMQQAIYPSDSFTVSEVYFNVTVQVKDKNDTFGTIFQLDMNVIAMSSLI